MSKRPYKIKYFINIDFEADGVAMLTEDDAKNHRLKEYEFPGDDAKYKLIDKIRVVRRTIEEYEQKPNDSNKK